MAPKKKADVVVDEKPAEVEPKMEATKEAETVVEKPKGEVARRVVKVKLPNGKIVDFPSTAHEDPMRAARSYAHGCGGVVMED